MFARGGVIRGPEGRDDSIPLVLSPGYIVDLSGRLRVQEQTLRHIAERAQSEADAGAPGPMVAIYVRMEVEHALAGHDGNAQDCDTCMAARRQQR